VVWAVVGVATLAVVGGARVLRTALS